MWWLDIEEYGWKILTVLRHNPHCPIMNWKAGEMAVMWADAEGCYLWTQPEDLEMLNYFKKRANDVKSQRSFEGDGDCSCCCDDS